MAAQTGGNRDLTAAAAAVERAAHLKACEMDVVVESRSGIIRGEFGGTERRSGCFRVIVNLLRCYHFPAERCTLVPHAAGVEEAHALHVAHTYRWERTANGARCSHPTQPDRSYMVEQDADGEWSCSCKAFQFDRRNPEFVERFGGGGACKHILAWSLVNGDVK